MYCFVAGDASSQGSGSFGSPQSPEVVHFVNQYDDGSGPCTPHRCAGGHVPKADNGLSS